MSDRTVYAIASGKGGVGKTTTAINLGAMLANRGHSVVVVDTDLGMANLAGFLDFEIETPTLHEVLAGEADFGEAIYEAPGHIDVLPSATDIEAFTKSNPKNLQGVVADLRKVYDYVLLDTGAGVSYDTLVPLALADAVILVATPDVASVRDTAKTGELARRVETDVAGAVLAQRSSDILNADDVEETLGTDVLAVVPQDEAVPMGIDAGRPLASFAPNAPAGKAYRDLAAVVIGEAEPDPELEAVSDGEDSGDATPQRRDEPAEQASEQDAKAPEDPESEGHADAKRERRSAPPEDQLEGVEGGADDPLSPDAAQSVRDAIGAEASAEEDALFEDETSDESAENDAGTTDEPAADDSDANDDARSVDDLINEHISDERLSGEAEPPNDDDPIAQIRDELADDETTDFLDRDDDDPEEKVAEIREQAGSNPGSVPFEEESATSETDAELDSGQTDAGLDSGADGTESELAGRDAETDPATSDADSDPTSSDVAETDSEPMETDETERNGGGTDARDADQSQDADQNDEDTGDSSGLFGRIGSLFG